MTHFHSSAWAPLRGTLKIARGVVHVIRLRLDLPDDRCQHLAQFLTEDERVRAARFRVDGPRQQFVICRSTLRRLLSSCYQIGPTELPIECGNHGKPSVPTTALGQAVDNVEFNVSHSGQLGLIALTIDSPVGVDVEEFDTRVQILKLAERFFSPHEAVALTRLAPEKQLAGFYRGWTCKEAYIKAIGNGLSQSLASFRVEIDPDQPARLAHIDERPEEIDRWTTHSLDVGANYAAAVMVAHPDCRIECHDWIEDPA